MEVISVQDPCKEKLAFWAGFIKAKRNNRFVPADGSEKLGSDGPPRSMSSAQPIRRMGVGWSIPASEREGLARAIEAMGPDLFNRHERSELAWVKRTEARYLGPSKLG